MAGFCSDQTVREGLRGVFHWNETEVNSYAISSCFYGPPGVTVTRLCVANGLPAPPAITACRTVISSNFLNIKNLLLNVSVKKTDFH